MTTLHFDAISHLKQLRLAGFNQEQAEIQTVALEKVINSIGNNSELATKQDIQVVKQDIQVVKRDIQIEIANLRVELIKWILAVGVGTVIALAGIVKYVH